MSCLGLQMAVDNHTAGLLRSWATVQSVALLGYLKYHLLFGRTSVSTHSLLGCYLKYSLG